MTLFHTSRQFFNTRDSNRVAKSVWHKEWSALNTHQKRVVNQEIFEKKWVRK
jgi:hypothetical protein